MADEPLKVQLVVDKAGPDMYCGRSSDYPDMIAIAPTMEGAFARAPYAMTEYLQANKIFGPVDLTVVAVRSYQVMVNPPQPPRPPGPRPAGQAQGQRPTGAPGKPRPAGAKPGAPAAPPRPKLKILTLHPHGSLSTPEESGQPTSPSAATTASTPTLAKP